MDGHQSGAVINGRINEPDEHPSWGEQLERDIDPVTNQEEIYAKALAIMVRPGRKLVTLGWVLSCALAVCLLAGVMVVLVLALDRGVPVQTLSIDTSKLEGVPPNGDGGLRYVVHRRRSCATQIQRVFKDAGGMRFIDPKEKPLYVPPPPLDELGRQEFSVPVHIDREMAPGRACGVVNLDYFCNPLQRFLSWPIADVSPRFCWNVGAKP